MRGWIVRGTVEEGATGGRWAHGAVGVHGVGWTEQV
jgi:hypothetical protein